MRHRILSYIIISCFIFSILLGTANALFADSETASISLTAARIEMRLSKITGDDLPSVLNVTVVNDGTVNADLWIENIYRLQDDAAKPDLNALSGGTEDVTIEITYKGAITSFILNDLDGNDSPYLLLEGMEPGSDALVTIKHNAGLQPNDIQQSLAKDSLANNDYEKISVSVPYIVEFILKSDTFTSLTGKYIFLLTTFFNACHQSDVSDEPTTELEETSETRMVDDSADLPGVPEEGRLESSASAVTVAPEPTEAPSEPALSEAEG